MFVVIEIVSSGYEYIAIGTPLKFHNMKENHFIKIRSDADVFGCRESPVNQSVIMNCNADGHQTMKWYKNGELLDLNSEGTMFNQTTGELVIRREDACELLGVYQCFASNEIDTVHVSTRVLPLGKESLLIVTVLLECFNRVAQPSRKT